MTEDDVKYFYAEQKKIDKDITPIKFKDDLLLAMGEFDEAYIMEAQTNKLIPVGAFFGINAGPFLLIGNAMWFSWASHRNRIEAAVNAINELRKKRLLIFYSNYNDKKFYEYICKHGILRRVGTIEGLYKGEPAAMFQSKLPNWMT